MQNCKTTKPTLGALAAAALLTGCMNLAPQYERPPAPVAPAFPNAEAAAVRATAAADTPWQAYFTDPVLRDLIERALKNNRDLRVAVLNIDAVQAQYQLRRADQYPTVSAGLTGSRLPGSGGSTVSAYTAGLSIATYELDLFGRVRSLTDSAAAQVLASDEARKAVQISLVASVANLYLALAADEELLELTVRTLDTREQSLKLTQLRFDNGTSSDLDLRLAQSVVEGARAALALARRQRDLDRNALVLLLGEALPVPPSRPARIDGIELSDVPAGLPSEVLLRRPDVRQAEQQLIAANANIGAARAAFWPRITLTGSAGTASTHLGDLFQNGAWGFSAQLLQPIFDAGRNQANLDGAVAQRDIAVAQYERAIQAAFRDVADALAGRATFDEQLRAQQAQVEAERARYGLSELRFRHGVSNSLELLDAERSLFTFEVALVQARLSQLQNRVSLYRALAGGLDAASPAS